MKSTSGVRHCLVALLLAASLAQTAVAASIVRGSSHARIGSTTAESGQPSKELPARIRRFLVWLYDQLEIPKP
jgi:hypothetical protein